MRWFTFSFLDLFLQVSSKKSIRHFDVIQLISQQFTRRDVKPVAFLVHNNLSGSTEETRIFIAEEFIFELADCMNTYDRKDPARLIMSRSQ